MNDCNNQTKANKKDADAECKDQYNARQEVCQQLVGDSYEGERLV
jgi:hypothetical protein